MIECIGIMASNPQCNIDVADDQGCTPLHVAVALGNLQAVSALLAAGAQCDSTSLEWQCSNRKSCYGAPEAASQQCAAAGVRISSGH
jgi:ankyrin repeat protein